MELDATGAVSATNTFGATGLVSRHPASGSSIFYTFDERGNTVQRLDSGGNVLSSHLSDAFGVTNTTAGTVTVSVGASDPFQFGGQSGYYTDAETGLVLCGHRYYDPGTGRWLNRDPIGYTGGINLYAYCTSNPVNFTDPLGFSGSGGGDIITDAKEMVATGIRDLKDEAINFWSSYGMVGVAIGGTTATALDVVGSGLHGYLNFGTGMGTWFGGGFQWEDLGGVGEDMATAASTGLMLAGATPMKFKGEAPPVELQNCFVAGTLIQMSDGSTKPIEEVKPGDQVLTKDQDATDQQGKYRKQIGVTSGKVVRTFVHEVTTTLKLHFDNGENLTTTLGHPFFVKGKGWTLSGNLRVGDEVVTRSGSTTQILTTKPGKTAVVYNFEVEKTHTYFVGKINGGLWVHNTSYIRGAKTGEAPHTNVRPGVDIKVVDGMVHPGRGLSVVNDASQLHPSYGDAYPVKFIPEGLKVIQHGKPWHFEIAPAKSMPFSEYQGLLNLIELGEKL